MSTVNVTFRVDESLKQEAEVLYKDLGQLGMWADKDEMLMIGDASGKPGQFSDSDRKTAENFGIDYMDVEEFILS